MSQQAIHVRRGRHRPIQIMAYQVSRADPTREVADRDCPGTQPTSVQAERGRGPSRQGRRAPDRRSACGRPRPRSCSRRRRGRRGRMAHIITEGPTRAEDLRGDGQSLHAIDLRHIPGHALIGWALTCPKGALLMRSTANHRFSTAQSADRIYMLNERRVVDSGCMRRWWRAGNVRGAVHAAVIAVPVACGPYN